MRRFTALQPRDRLLLLASLSAFIYLWVWLPLKDPRYSIHHDFHVVFLAATAVAQGLNPYDFATLEQMAVQRELWEPPAAFTHPIVSALLVAPLLPLGYGWAHLVYYTATLLSFLGAVRIGISLAGDTPTAWRWAAGAGFAWPVAMSLSLGQVDGFIALAVAVSCWAVARQPRWWPVLAGLPVGLVAGLKLIPAVLLGYFVFSRRYAAAAWLLAGLLAALLLPDLLLGWGTLAAWVGQIGYLRSWIQLAENVTLTGLLARLYVGPSGYYNLFYGELPRWLTPAGLTLSALVLGWGLFRAIRLTPVSAYATLLAAGLLAAPTAWDHYPTWILALCIPLFAAASSQERVHRWVLGAGVALLLFPVNGLYHLGWLPLQGAGLPWKQVGLLLVLLSPGVWSVRLVHAPPTAPRSSSPQVTPEPPPDSGASHRGAVGSFVS